MTEKCENCLYLRRLKHNFTAGKGYEESKCCVALLEIDGSEDGWAQEVKDGGFCELYERRTHGSRG